MKSFKVKVLSKEHSIVIQDRLFKLGYGWGFETEQVYKHSGAKYLFGHRDGGLGYSSMLTTFENFDKTEVTTDFFFIEKEYVRQEFVFNDNYTAIIRENSVDVGCQKFPNEVIDKFITAYTEAHAKDKS
jgi:hypothetical protein